jgi:hypothetical protein
MRFSKVAPGADPDYNGKSRRLKAMGQQNYGSPPEPPHDDRTRRGPAPIGPRANPPQSDYPPPGHDPRYDPRQAPSGYAQQQYGQQPYENAPQQYPPGGTGFRLPSWVPRDPTTLGVLAAGALALGLCVVAFCVMLLVLGRPIPPPAVPPTSIVTVPTTDPLIIWTPTPAPTPVPPFNPALVGTLLNPYFAAGLEGMQRIDMYILDPGAGGYAPRTQILAGSAEMEFFVTALNIANFITAPNAACPDHVRLVITRADGVSVTIGVCLNQAVILRGDIPGLSGGDLPMGPYFIDLLRPYLPDTYARLLD